MILDNSFAFYRASAQPDFICLNAVFKSVPLGKTIETRRKFRRASDERLKLKYRWITTEENEIFVYDSRHFSEQLGDDVSVGIRRYRVVVFSFGKQID